MLTREQILAADDLRRIKVEVPEWGGSVWMRVMTGTEEFTFNELVNHRPDIAPGQAVPLIRETLLAMTLCDAAGGRLFDTHEVAALGNKSQIVIMRLFDVARDLNKLKADAVDIEIKNSESIPGDASGTDLPSSLAGAPSTNGSDVSTPES